MLPGVYSFLDTSWAAPLALPASSLALPLASPDTSLALPLASPRSSAAFPVGLPWMISSPASFSLLVTVAGILLAPSSPCL